MGNIKVVFLVILLGLGWSLPVCAALAVIVHPNNKNVLDEAEIRRIFLGKVRAFPDGSAIVPFDQAVGSNVRAEFVSKLLKRNEDQLKAYWVRMLFSSKAIPPKVVTSPDEIKKIIADNPQSIGYIDASLIDSSVKVVFLTN